MVRRKRYKDYLTPSEAAERAGVTTPTVVNWCFHYEGLGIKVGGRWRISPEVLSRVLDGSLEGKDRVVAE